ncbi:hypothetical protein [Halobacillus massiliensis]|uniref:hypothetical protein n=1 Tax=Halobacillus massiliensis TaxID=1926286 RepID=UPI0009E55333|nr:hypothetical protein [Halobacillus massiliensis]
MPVSVVFNQIAVNSINENATISTGQNNQQDWNWQGKNNFAAGMPIGFFIALNNLNVLYDNDVIDTPSFNPEYGNPLPNIQY